MNAANAKHVRTNRQRVAIVSHDFERLRLNVVIDSGVTGTFDATTNPEKALEGGTVDYVPKLAA